ncbi:DUF3883 domain-containing protein, partial [Candidatus Woesearchaeota archaeon]|nr:DUF3883 domain-containing protein [Candidatus Woesearchaeota archaeon]
FILSENKLIIQNNEVGFNEENVRALCDVRKSTKKKVDGYVGEKGIGFKSVFKVSKSPEIHSNGYHFRFHTGKSKKKALLGYILPELIEDISDEIDSSLTNIVLPFPKKDYTKFSEQLSDIQPDLLLFLKKLKTIQIIDEIEGTEIVFKKKTKSSGFVELTERITDNWSNKSEENLYYRLFSETVNVPKKYATDERVNIEKTEIVIGFQLDKENNKYKVNSSNDCKVYNFLPINDYNFRFLIQADFILTSNRESVDESKPWNEWIREKTIESIKKSFIALQNTGLWTEYLNYLPRVNEISEDFFEPISEELSEWINNNKVVPVLDGEKHQWVKPNSICFHNNMLIKIYGTDFIQKKTKFRFLHPSTNFDSAINKIIGIEAWSWESEKLCIEDRYWLSSLSKNKRDDFYEHLSKEYLNDDYVIEDLKEMKIFYLVASEKPVSFSSSEDAIFWPIKSTYKFPFLNSIRFLSHDYRKSSILKYKRINSLFRKIGVSEPKIKTIINDFILPNYDYGNDNHSASRDLTKYHIEFLHFIYNNYEMIKRDSHIFKKIKDKIWLQSSSKQFSKPDHLYLTRNYEPNIIWENLFQKSEVSFLNKDYLRNGFNKNEKKRFVTFLYEIGLKHKANTEDIVSVFQSESISRIKYLLIYLNDNWNEYSRIINKEKVVATVKIPVKDELFSPSSLFIPSRQNKYVLGETANYLPKYITNKEFVKDLKVNIKTIPNAYLIAALKSIKQDEKTKVDKKRLVTIYSKFKSNEEPDSIFSEESLLYSFREKKWLEPWQVVWQINIDHFVDFFSEFGSQYSQDLLAFFLKNAGININIEFDNIVQFLKIISSKDKINQIDRERIEKAIGFLAVNIKNRKLNSNSIEDITKNSSIYPDELNYLKSADEIYFGDNDHLYGIFKNKGSSIFYLSNGNIGFRSDIINVSNDFNLELLTNHCSTDYSPPRNLRSNKEWSEEIKDLLSLVGYILNYRSQEVYDEFHQIFEDVEKIKLFIVNNLLINYSLGSITESVEESYYILNNRIYVSKSEMSSIESLITDIVIRILGNKSIVTDIVLFLVNNSNERNLLKYFDRFKIPYPNIDLRLFAKEKKKQLKDEEIVDIEDFDGEDELDNESYNDTVYSDLNSITKRQTNRANNETIQINVKAWEPEIEPDFEVEISESEFLGDKENHSGNEGSGNWAGGGGGFFPRYEFSSDKTYEKEIGNWGERFAFNNLAKELIKQYKGNEFIIDKEKQKLQIFNSKGNQLVLFENRNVQGLTQSGYDFLLSTKDCDLFIEVKSTTRSGSSKFNLEENQWNCCRENKDKFILVIVRNAGIKTATVERIPNLYKMYEDGKIYIKPGRMVLYI